MKKDLLKKKVSKYQDTDWTTLKVPGNKNSK